VAILRDGSTENIREEGRMRKNMKKSIAYASTLVALAIMLAMIPASAVAGTPPTAPGKNKLACFIGGGGTCTLNKNGTTATLDTTGTTVGVGFAGVYLPGYNSSFYGVRVAQVTALSFTFTGTASTVDPHWSIPIDSNHDGNTDYWLYVPAITCNNGAGLVDVINNPACTIYDSRSALVSYPNWAAYIAANTNDYIALNDYYAFPIADSTVGGGVWTISNVTVGKPGK
jgi:hypothetical protein